MDKDGRLVWDVPAGHWTVRVSATPSPASTNARLPASGCGLECDKLSKEGIEAQFGRNDGQTCPRLRG